jgi:hypothetical protein
MIKIHSVCLIIDSDYPFREHYARQRLLWKKYMNLDPEIKCFFIRLSETISSDIVVDESNNIIYVKGKEEYIPGILIKTLKAMEYVYNTFDFDYLIRTNISTFWNFKLYKNKFSTPKNNLIEAIIGLIGSLPFPSGYGMVISKDVIFKMITLQDEFDYSLNDDVSMGKFLYDKNIPIISAKNYVYHFIYHLLQNEILSKIHSNIDKMYQFRIVYDRGLQDNYIFNNLYTLSYNPLNYLS